MTGENPDAPLRDSRQASPALPNPVLKSSAVPGQSAPSGKQKDSASPPTAQLSGRFVSHLRDAQMMLAFVCRAGREVKEEVVRPIVEADRMRANRGFTRDKEVAFWVAFDALARLADPATVETIRANQGINQGGSRWDWVIPGRGGIAKADEETELEFQERSAAQQVVSKFRRLTFLALVVALVFQIYYLFGSSVVERIEDNRKAIRDLTGGIESLSVEVREINFRIASSESPLTDEIRQELLSQKDQKFKESQQKQSLLKYISKNNDGDYHTLDIINPFFSLDNKDNAEDTNNPISMLQLQKFLDEIVLKYLLPVFLGMLGACAYILRRISREIDEVTFSPSNEMHYDLRVYLGMIAGLAVVWFSIDTWFSTGENGGVFSVTSPLALAFIAGYSVELIFAALDGIIGAFIAGRGRSTSSSK